MKYTNFPLFFAVPLLSIIATGCGSSSSSSSSTGGGAVSSVSIANLPSASSMITTNSSSSNFSPRSGEPYTIHSVRSVSGTAPILSSITNTNVDTYFWNGLLTTMNGLGIGIRASDSQISEFYGKTVPGAGGMGACQMAQGVGESFSNLISAGGTLCYMKGIAAGPSGVTVTGVTIPETAATLFDPYSDGTDKLIKITLSGAGGGEMPEAVFFKIYGSNTLGGSDTYKADLWMCKTGAVNQIETITVVKSTGAFTDVSTDVQSGNGGTSTLTATLKTGANGSPTFDATKNRRFVGKYSGTYFGNTNVYKGDLTINSNNEIISKIYRSNNGSWGLYIDKVSSVSSFSGSTFADLRFLAAGFNGASTFGSNTNTYSGGIEFQDTHYVTVAGSTLAASAAEVDVTTDSFYTSDLSAPTLTTTQSCTDTPTVNVTMDFSATGVTAIKDTCDSDRYTNYSMCYGSTVNGAQAHTWGP